MEPDLSSSLTASSSKQLAARLRSFESRLDALQVEAAASGAAAADFATEASQRLAGLEAEVRRLSHGGATALQSGRSSLASAPSFGASGGQDAARKAALAALAEEAPEDLLTRATNGLLDDVRGCARRLLAAVGQDVTQAIEAGKLAAIAAAERAVAEHIQMIVRPQLSAKDVNRKFAQLEAGLPNNEACASLASTAIGGNLLDRSSLQLLAETRQASAEASAAEARISAKISQCVSLIDVACSPANRPGLEALRDLVDSLESVSTRVAALENCALRGGYATGDATLALHSPNARHSKSPTSRSPGPIDGDLSPTSGALAVTGRLGACSPRAMRNMDARVSARFDSRLDKLEQSLPAMHDRLHESLLVLWSAVREISRELCANGAISGAGGGKVASLVQRSGSSPQRSPRPGPSSASRRTIPPLAAFREAPGRGAAAGQVGWQQ